MNHVIENEALRVTVSSMGAEMISAVDKNDGTEYVWQGDATYWTGHAYNLFPICGRLTEGKYTYKVTACPATFDQIVVHEGSFTIG